MEASVAPTSSIKFIGTTPAPLSLEGEPISIDRNKVMKTTTYNGYTAEIIYSDEDECFVGHVVNIGDDIVGFHGDTDEELRDAFENMVELYIETLAEPEISTQKQNAGGFWARLRQALYL